MNKSSVVLIRAAQGPYQAKTYGKQYENDNGTLVKFHQMICLHYTLRDLLTISQQCLDHRLRPTLRVNS